MSAEADVLETKRKALASRLRFIADMVAAGAIDQWRYEEKEGSVQQASGGPRRPSDMRMITLSYLRV